MKRGSIYKYMLMCFLLAALAFSAIACTTKKQTATPPPGPSPTQPAPTEQPSPAPKPAQQKPIGVYMPMKVGNVWEYEGEGNEYASYTMRVEFEEGNRYQLTRDNGGTVIADIYEVTEDSIAHVYQMGEEYEHKNVLNVKNNLKDVVLKKPIEMGNKWVSEENSYEIITTKAAVTVPYGTYTDCVLVKRVYKDGGEDYLYFKDGIGLVQSEFRLGDVKIFSRLKKFSSK